MRVTGVAVMVVGAAIMTFCGVMWMWYDSAINYDAGMVMYSKRTANNFLIPMGIAGATITIGMYFAVFGDKGFIFSRNLAEKN